VWPSDCIRDTVPGRVVTREPERVLTRGDCIHVLYVPGCVVSREPECTLPRAVPEHVSTSSSGALEIGHRRGRPESVQGSNSMRIWTTSSHQVFSARRTAASSSRNVPKNVESPLGPIVEGPAGRPLSCVFPSFRPSRFVGSRTGAAPADQLDTNYERCISAQCAVAQHHPQSSSSYVGARNSSHYSRKHIAFSSNSSSRDPSANILSYTVVHPTLCRRIARDSRATAPCGAVNSEMLALMSHRQSTESTHVHDLATSLRGISHF